MFHALYAGPVLLLFCSLNHTLVDADEYWSKRVGKPTPLVVATTATGPHATRFPFNSQTYGKVSGFAPATRAAKPCIVIYGKNLNDYTLAIAFMIDRITQSHPEMDAAYFYLFDAKGAQRGGYTADELAARLHLPLAELESVAESLGGQSGLDEHLGLAGKTVRRGERPLAVAQRQPAAVSGKQPSDPS